jgi:N-acetylmuramate 1-kinase
MNLTFETKSTSETESIAEKISLWAKPGLAIALEGELGAGKSTFARAFIKALANRQEVFDVPSPSFSLIQLYDNTRVPVAHIDLYRLSTQQEIDELALAELLSTHILLVEWAEKSKDTLSKNLLVIQFLGAGENRKLELKASGSWASSLERNLAIDTFLATTNWNSATRDFLEGDASSRRYETIAQNLKSVILMDMPQRPDGPPVKDGLPYSAIAHLAENISSVVKVNQQLKEFGYSAPSIEASDLTKGLALIELLDGKVYGHMMRAGENMKEPMQVAVAVLADMAKRDWPTTILSYDRGAQLIEVDLLVSWFWPYIHGRNPDISLHNSFAEIWNEVLPLADTQKPHWVLRDYHSPNLIWLPERKGLKRVGIIDTQDAVLGHEAYDLASMLQDARVDIDFKWADQLYQHYEELRMVQGNFDAKNFSAAYAILGAQRATKILGIFARLSKRDGKSGYLKHMPRVSRYLAKNLEHPKLTKLKAWYENHLPQALKVGQS